MAKKTQILIVEDDIDTQEMLRTYFEAQGYHVLVANNGTEALNVCEQTLPDLILQDIRLPDMEGYDVVRNLRRNLRTSHIPIIFLTERKSRNDKLSGLKLGAVDYITKPFDMQELRLRVRNTIRRATYQSLINPITGLPGLRVCDAQIEETLQEKQPWGLLYVRMTGLDAFNDIYGFVAGDDVIRAVGLILSNVVDETGTLDDFVGHLGKADFVVITAPDRLAALQERLIARLQRSIQYFYPLKDRESPHPSVRLTVQLGTVLSNEGRFSSAAEVKQLALSRLRTFVTG